MTFQTMALEDGERVIKLRGGRGAREWKSSRPHAGSWGQDRDYVLVPCRTRYSVGRRAEMATRSFLGLENRSSDAEVLLLGGSEVIRRLITEGPIWCRAMVSRKGQPRSVAQEVAAGKLRAMTKDRRNKP